MIVEAVEPTWVWFRKAGFLQGLRALCDQHHALLIFDEVITGFRLVWGAAVFWCTPGSGYLWKNHWCRNAGRCIWRKKRCDGTGFSGRKSISGRYFSGNPVAMAAGLTQLKYLYDHQEIYTELEKRRASLRWNGKNQ